MGEGEQVMFKLSISKPTECDDAQQRLLKELAQNIMDW